MCRNAMRKPILALLPAVALSVGLFADPASSQGWNPFDYRKSGSDSPQSETQPPQQEVAPAPMGEIERSVERGDLAPVMADDGSDLPYELWRGIDVPKLEGLMSELQIPPRSAALHSLWLRLITSNVTPPPDGSANEQFMALRLEALYRSGLLEAASRELTNLPASTPLLAILAARNEIALGHTQEGCKMASSAGAPGAHTPKPLMGQAALISGYCAAIAGDTAGAGLAAELAREEGVTKSAGLRALDAISLGAPPNTTPDEPLTVLDYRLIQAAHGDLDAATVLKNAGPALLAALSLDPNTEPGLKLAAGEAAAQANSIMPDELASIYRQQGAAPGADAPGTSLHRASLFVAAETETTPQRKVRFIRSFLDDARRAGLYLTALRMVAPLSNNIVPTPDIGWYAETAVEVALAADDPARARIWANFGSSNGAGNLDHWLTLIDIADVQGSGDRDASLRYVEGPAVQGRLDPTLLHRLATVLDALEYNVPIPLWEAASRTPQPAGGYLPETGVLSELQQASKKQEFGRTVLLVMKTLGPDGAEGANLLALGDSIRALKRAGIEADARRLGFEALFASWPRTIVN